MWRCASALLVSVIVIGTATPLEAQDAVRPSRQVISANPFGVLLDWFNAEYEHTVSNSTTLGVGGSFLSDDGDDYVNADVFYRFYPSGRALEGFSFGVKVGATRVPAARTRFGLGFDTNWSWLLGQRDTFYVAAGFGLKRLYGTNDREVDWEYIPTIRIINIGLAF
jgi:hypothetical protein